jgi:gamma-glutamylcyclotransferase (GGCT)/AIG2-like uncharacterized protein YtfP
MNTPTYNLFVYGSLRSGFRNPVYEYLTRYFKYEGEAVVKGQFFDKGSYPVAVPTAEEHFIQGELYSLHSPEDFSWAFEQLDDYEGINTEAGEKPLYKREPVNVYQNGEMKQAWIYWFNHSVEGFEPMETGDVMKYLQQKNKP